MLNKQNKEYWQNYKPGEIPSPSQEPPKKLLLNLTGNVLDIGTGDGNLAEKIATRDVKVYGIDIAENIIEENKKRKTKVIYSVQDITSKTSFPDNYFDLITFKYTLTNIHKESWTQLGSEIFRILRPQGMVWVFEPLVSESYLERYKLSNYFVEDKNCVYVFSEKDLAKKINNKEQLEEAIKQKKVIRVIKHYTKEELEFIFSKLKLSEWRKTHITSPSGFNIDTFEGVFKKHM